MKKILVLFICYIPYCLATTVSDQACGSTVCTYISPRSVSEDAARELAGWENLVNNSCNDSFSGCFACTPEVMLTFRPERIVQCLFGDDVTECNLTFTVAGSRDANRLPGTWLADYFGLPTDYKSIVTLFPQVMNVLIDLNAFIGLDQYVPGLYFRIHAPVTLSRWNLNTCETFIVTGTNAHDPGYFNPEGIPRKQLVGNFTQFITGQETPEASDLTFHPLCHAKMNCRSMQLTRLSEIQIALGYNIIQNPCAHFGIQIRGSIPTGNRPTGEFLFEPIIGNGHHAELGGGISSHIQLWENEEREEKAALFADLNVTHLFATRQCRSFDLKNGSNSRYMLAQKMGIPITDNLQGVINSEQKAPTVQYQKEVTTVANLTTLPINVSNAVQVDFALMLAYTHARNSWTFGYSVWLRSCDTITLCGPTPFDIQTWALKGDAQLFGFEHTVQETAVALSATQSNATINSGLDFSATGANTPELVDEGITNPHIDNPANAVSDSDNDGIFQTLVAQPGATNQIKTSIQPITLTTQDINIASAQTRGLSQKIFSSYTHFVPRNKISAYLGFGAEIEFGQHSFCENKSTNKNCLNTALSFWGCWLKVGAHY